eukprot:COSAG04_NODE_1306_length_7295_cov_3.324208_8_plen_466_part_00
MLTAARRGCATARACGRTWRAQAGWRGGTLAVGVGVGAGASSLLGGRRGAALCAADPPRSLAEALELGMDGADAVIAHGKRRRLYAEDARRYDGSALWLTLGNLLRRLHESGLRMCGCCCGLGASIWVNADKWTIAGSLLSWAAGSLAVASALFGALLGGRSLVFGPPATVPTEHVATLERLWKERTDVEDQLLREVVLAARAQGEGKLLGPQPVALSTMTCGGRPADGRHCPSWSLLQRVAVVSPLPPPEGATPTELEWMELAAQVFAAMGYHSSLCWPRRGAKPPRFCSDVIEEWSAPLRHSRAASLASPSAAAAAAPAAGCGLRVRVMLRERKLHDDCHSSAAVLHKFQATFVPTGGRGGARPRSAQGGGSELLFAAIEFQPGAPSRSASPPEDGEGEPGRAVGERCARVVLVDEWAMAGGVSSEKEVRQTLSALRVLLDARAVGAAESTGSAQRRLIYSGQ